jgi:hypothetical protein
MSVASSSSLARKRPDLANWLNGSDFVVGHHDRDHDRIRSQRFSNIFDPDKAVPVNWQARHFPSLLLQLCTNSSHRRMLDCRRNHVTTVSTRSLTQTANGKVVRFRTT